MKYPTTGAVEHPNFARRLHGMGVAFAGSLVGPQAP
jgi:hypothetical protein